MASLLTEVDMAEREWDRNWEEGEGATRKVGSRRQWGYLAWVLAIAGFAALHALHLRADFPNGSPWVFDWAKYTDEGWYGNGAVRAHLFGSWYAAGDFNPAAAVPAWPFLEWLLFFATGVKVEAARGLAVACFAVSVVLSYLLVRSGGSRWTALAAVTLAVTSPFLYCFSRLAILEPLETTLTLAALNAAVRLPRMKRREVGAAGVGLLLALAALTKTTAVFLVPAAIWAIWVGLRNERRVALRCALTAVSATGIVYGLWVAWVVRLGLLGDYKYYFFVNNYPKPAGVLWPVTALWWSIHGLLWVDHSVVFLAGGMVLGAGVAWRTKWGRGLWRAPVFGASILAVAGFVLFMTVQNHPQPRYFAVPAFFCYFVAAMGAEGLLRLKGWRRAPGWVAIAAIVGSAGVHGVRTIGYAFHPEYTFVNAAEELTQYIDGHPNGRRMLVSISGDEIALVTGLPGLCDDFGTMDLPSKLAKYQPGWYASWNDIDAGTLEDLHAHYSLEEAATFRAFDDPDRNELVLFKLHPLPGGLERDGQKQNLREALPGDKIEVPVE